MKRVPKSPESKCQMKTKDLSGKDTNWPLIAYTKYQKLSKCFIAITSFRHYNNPIIFISVVITGFVSTRQGFESNHLDHSLWASQLPVFVQSTSNYLSGWEKSKEYFITWKLFKSSFRVYKVVLEHSHTATLICLDILWLHLYHNIQFSTWDRDLNTSSTPKIFTNPLFTEKFANSWPRF